MDTFTGKVAVVTGAASGIGLAMAERFAAEGMAVVLADVEQDALDRATATVAEIGSDAIGVRTDVSDPAAVERLVERAVDTFGAINILCNNAGVIRSGTAWEQSEDDWTWMLGVNLLGVVHGLRACIPRMLAQGDACHIVNTSSAGGLVPSWGGGAYAATKAGVVAISEGVADALSDTQIGVSLLCPGGVATDIFRSERNRPAELARTGVMHPKIQQTLSALASADRTDQVVPEMIAGLVVEAIRTKQFYVLPMQAHFKQTIVDRMTRIADALAASPTTDA